MKSCFGIMDSMLQLGCKKVDSGVNPNSDSSLGMNECIRGKLVLTVLWTCLSSIKNFFFIDLHLGKAFHQIVNNLTNFCAFSHGIAENEPRQTQKLLSETQQHKVSLKIRSRIGFGYDIKPMPHQLKTKKKRSPISNGFEFESKIKLWGYLLALEYISKVNFLKKKHKITFPFYENTIKVR